MSDYDAAFDAAIGGAPKVSNEYDDVFKSSLGATLMKPVIDYNKEAPSDVGFKGNLRFATPFGNLDTRIPLPEFVNKRLAQFGSGIADLGSAFASPDAVDEKRAIDKTLNDSGPGGAMHFLGKVAPTMALPNVGGPVIGGMLAGGAIGALEPVGTGESRISNALTSAALGGIIPGAIKGAQALAQPSAAKKVLAESALKQGIPLGIADITDNAFIKGTRSVLNDLPWIGGIGANQNAAKQQAFNKAVGGVIGENASALTPEVMAGAKSRIGGELNRVWDNNNLKLDGKYVTDLQRIMQDASEKLNPEQATAINKHVQSLLSKADNAEIPGAFTNNWQSELRLAADGEKGLAQKILNDLRQSTLQAFNRGVTGADASALTKARTQYGALKTIEPLMNSAEAGVAGRVAGDVPAALLPQKIVQQYGSASRSPFGDLPQIGSQFVADRVPRTGGSARAIVQNMLTTGAIGGAGGGIPLALGGGAVGAGMGAVAGLGAAGLLEKALGSPALAKGLLAPSVQRKLTDSPELRAALIELTKNSASRLPVAAGMGLLSAPALE